MPPGRQEAAADSCSLLLHCFSLMVLTFKRSSSCGASSSALRKQNREVMGIDAIPPQLRHQRHRINWGRRRDEVSAATSSCPMHHIPRCRVPFGIPRQHVITFCVFSWRIAPQNQIYIICVWMRRRGTIMTNWGWKQTGRFLNVFVCARPGTDLKEAQGQKRSSTTRVNVYYLHVTLWGHITAVRFVRRSHHHVSHHDTQRSTVFWVNSGVNVRCLQQMAQELDQTGLESFPTWLVQGLYSSRNINE